MALVVKFSFRALARSPVARNVQGKRQRCFPNLFRLLTPGNTTTGFVT
jgi:hypothetical protein